MTRALVILNPKAGNAHQRRAVAQGLTEWRSRFGWRVALHETKRAGDATRIASKEAQRFDYVIAAGGDGTINETLNGVVGSHAALGAIPMGTGNVWVRELHQSLNPLTAARQLVDAEPVAVDVGQAGERFFLLMAGVGFDAAITAAVRSADKHRLGRLAYLIRSVPIIARMRGVRTRVAVDGQPVKGDALFVLISNSRRYGGVINIAHRATITDGLLDVCVMHGSSALAIPRLLAGVLLHGHGLVPGLNYFQARSVEVACSRPLPVQVDGDTIGKTPMHFTVLPAAVRVLLPQTVVPEHLLAPPRPRLAALRRRSASRPRR